MPSRLVAVPVGGNNSSRVKQQDAGKHFREKPHGKLHGKLHNFNKCLADHP